MKCIIMHFLFLVLPMALVDADNWAVLAAGSKGWENYRHQADICHAYQLVKSHGIPEDNIILMMYDDVAKDPKNPFPGQLYNHPEGPDVYNGCNIDYRGDEVTGQLFMNVLLGNDAAVNNSTGKSKVLKSGPNDSVFINFADHGGPGMIMFPDGGLHAQDLLNTLTKMHSKKMYKKLLFYMEACFSGSMFTQLPTNLNIFATTAAAPGENSFATYCMSKVHGKKFPECLGDMFSVSWMEDSDNHDLTKETLKSQLATVTTEVWNCPFCASTVSQYGDKSIADEVVGNYIGLKTAMRTVLPNAEAGQRIPVPDVKLYLKRIAWFRSNGTEEETIAWKELQDEIKHREKIKTFFTTIVNYLCPDSHCRETIMKRNEGITDLQCHKGLTEIINTGECIVQWDDYSLQFAGVLANLCNNRHVFNWSTTQLMKEVISNCKAAL